MSDKEKEIKLLQELCEMGGYFAEYFKADLETMVYNITNDFPIEMDTAFHKAAEVKDHEIKTLKKNHTLKVESLCETLLCVHENGNEDGRAKERAVQELGLHRVVQIKRQIGLEWDAEDKNYITKMLETNIDN